LRSGTFYSKGKFLISGEYFVLYGAKSLAVPLKLGQKMIVSEIPQPGMIEWETTVLDKLWFSAQFRLEDMAILDSSDQKTAVFVRDLLKEGVKLQPELQMISRGFSIRNEIEFDIRWGMGSSSSLVSNLAYWLDIDPYALYRKTFDGSGYDVFCARANGPVTFQLKDGSPEIYEVPFRPAFTDHLYFIYLGRKQDSQESVRKFKALQLKEDKVINQVSDLTNGLVTSSDLNEFLTVIRLHEDVISAAIGLPAVKKEFFPDFNGEIKSLGAWGGDFVMAATKMEPEEVRDYFYKKNLDIVFGWDEIVFIASPPLPPAPYSPSPIGEGVRG
jgi:mevalonate kinase